MDLLTKVMDWAGRQDVTNAIGTFVALLAIPGGIWGFWLFSRWVRGKGLDVQVDRLLTQNADLGARVDQLLKQNSGLAEQNINLAATVQGLATEMAGRLLPREVGDSPTKTAQAKKERAENFGRAVADLAKRLDPTSRQVLELLRSGDVEAANRIFSKTLADKKIKGETLNSADAEIARAIGDVLQKSNVAEASKLFNRAAEADPNLTNWMAAGASATTAGRLDEALEHYEHARRLAEKIENYEGLATALSRRGETLRRLGQVDRAIEDLHSEIATREALARSSPTNDDSLLQLINPLGIYIATLLTGMYDLSGGKARAADVLKLCPVLLWSCQRLVEIDQTNAEYQGELAKAYMFFGDAHKSNNDAESALVMYRAGRALLEQLAGRFSEQSPLMQARKHFDDRIATMETRLRGKVQDPIPRRAPA